MRLAIDTPISGRLVRRYKRFFADVETPDGARLTVHCPNPGSMRGLLAPGAAVRCSTSDDPRRKLRHTLEMIRVGRAWVGVNTMRANALAARAIDAGRVPGLEAAGPPRPEVKVEEGTRIDFVLPGGDAPDTWLEVKSVTMAEGEVARFPDSVTERGRRHCEVLARRVKDGGRAALLFLVQRADTTRVEPADDVDPAYGRALRMAAHAGVRVLALRVRVTPTALRVETPIPVSL